MLLSRGLFIFEILRTARGFKSQEEFVDGICDVRQYRRYIKGDSQMPSEISILFISRLNMNIEEVLKFYIDTSNQEKKVVQNLYNRLMGDSFDGLDQEIARLQNKIFIEGPDQMLFNFCMQLYQFKTGKTTKLFYRDQVKKIIQFDQVLNCEIISIYEMLILSNIIEVLNEEENTKIVNLLTISLKKYRIDDVNSLDYYLISLYTLIRVHGSNNNYETALELCDLSIDLSKKFHHYYLLMQVYYLKALYFCRIGNTTLMKENIHSCIEVLDFGPKNSINSRIRSLLESNLDINITQFELEYWSEKINN